MAKPGIHIKGAGKQKQRLQKIADAANASVMKKVMVFARRLIVDRTHKGEFLNGSGKKYSTAGALYRLNDNALKREYRQRLIGANRSYQQFGRKGKKHRRRGMKKGDSTAKFIFLERGYEQYRQIHGRQVNHVDLNYDGDMIAAMNDITVKKNYGSLGFLQSDEERKARFLTELGAGKNHVKYEFFGLSGKEKDRVGDAFDEAWTEELKDLGVL